MYNTEMMRDESIVELYFQRSERAIEESDRKYGKYLLSVAMNILKNEPDSEECRNDTYLRAWYSIPPTRPTHLGGYLARIVRNLSINRWKMLHRGRRVPPEMTVSLADYDNFLPEAYAGGAEELAAVLNKYLVTLTERQRYIFMSRYFYVREIKDVANALSVSVSTVKKELSTIKSELRKRLSEEGIDI